MAKKNAITLMAFLANNFYCSFETFEAFTNILAKKDAITCMAILAKTGQYWSKTCYHWSGFAIQKTSQLWLNIRQKPAILYGFVSYNWLNPAKNHGITNHLVKKAFKGYKSCNCFRQLPFCNYDA